MSAIPFLIPACGIYLRTPIGTIVHTGDFKFDHSPVDGEQTDSASWPNWATGACWCSADSTNAQNPGYTPSEAVVTRSLMESYGEARGRIILATFIQRIPYPDGCGRRRPLQAQSLRFRPLHGECSEYRPGNGLSRRRKAPSSNRKKSTEYRDDRLCILTTGSQGEPMAGLSRMADGSHRQVTIHA